MSALIVFSADYGVSFRHQTPSGGKATTTAVPPSNQTHRQENRWRMFGGQVGTKASPQLFPAQGVLVLALVVVVVLVFEVVGVLRRCNGTTRTSVGSASTVAATRVTGRSARDEQKRLAA